MSHLLYWAVAIAVFVGLCVVFKSNTRSSEEPYEGLLDSPTARRLPQAYVVYPEGFRSVDMPIGNARSYAKIFGGVVMRK